jgi:hypothetical protein
MQFCWRFFAFCYEASKYHTSFAWSGHAQGTWLPVFGWNLLHVSTCDLLDYLSCLCLFPNQLSIDFPCSLGEIWMIKSGSIWVCLLNYHQIWHDLVNARWSPRSIYLSSILACRGRFVAVRSMLLIWRLTLISSQALVDSTWSISCWFLWWDTLLLGLNNVNQLNSVNPYNQTTSCLTKEKPYAQVQSNISSLPLWRTRLPSCEKPYMLNMRETLILKPLKYFSCH